jgi:hypothetical protein
MLSHASRQLTDDHAALSEVLKQLHEALNGGNVEASHSRLDLFWARLAVHIRAEHLHLFPSVLKGLKDSAVGPVAEPSLKEGQLAVERLRGDHDFFMHELARAISTLRELLQTTDRRTIDQGLNAVRETILRIEKRLISHNETEENQIYRWATTVLKEKEQRELAVRINGELAKLPPRFTVNT